MSKISDNQTQIKAALLDYQKTIEDDALYQSNTRKWKEKCNSKFRQIQFHTHVLQDKLYQLPVNQSSKYNPVFRKYQQEAKRLKRQFQKKNKSQRDKSVLELSQRPLSYHSQQRQVQSMINRGDQAQKAMLEGLDSIDKTIEQGVALANQINLKLNQQINRLDSIQDTVKDTDSTLQRATKNLNYFIKALQCDKCMMVLLLLIALALVAVVVLLIKNNVSS